MIVTYTHVGFFWFLRWKIEQMTLGPGLSVFDAIETDDNENITWEEFRRFFEAALEGDAPVDLQASGRNHHVFTRQPSRPIIHN